MTFEIGLSFFQCTIWIAITYTLVRYFQTMIHIERQYKYIAVIEQEVSRQLEWPSFDRESNSYLKNYPKALDLIHVFYTWIIPLLLILINLLKIALEAQNGTTIFPFIFDTICCLFCTVLSILYLIFMHFPKDKKVQ